MQKIGIYCTRGFICKALKRKNFSFIMKVSLIVLAGVFLTGNIMLAHSGYSQGNENKIITVNFSNASFSEVFKSIEQQADVIISYEFNHLKSKGNVNISQKNITVANALSLILKEKGLTWDIRENIISIKRIKVSETTATQDVDLKSTSISPLSSPPITVRGRIVNEKGEPLAGASINMKGTNSGTIAGSNGLFSLEVNVGQTLVVSHVGYDAREVVVNSDKDIVIELELSLESLLNETVIIAYGTTTRRLNTGNVSSVKANDINKQPVNNPILALQGRVPGLTVIQSTGVPGGAVTVRIQGRNNLDYYSGSDPLIVVDGVPYPSQNLTTFASGWNGSPVLGQPNGIFNTSGSILSNISPENIESIDVLKDADATAIYGSRGANGAILITTKKGVKGDTKVEVNFQHGIGQVAKKLKLLNTQRYIEMRKEAFANDNKPLPDITTSPFDAQYDINGLWDTTRYTDWQKELIGGTASYTMAGLTVSGGTDNLNFVVGGTYKRETTVFPGDFANLQGSMYFNINATSSNKKFQIQASANYVYADNNIPGIDFTQFIFLAPNAPALFTSDGSINWEPTPQENSSWKNPLSLNRTIFESKTNNLISNTLLSYKLIDNLVLKTSVGFNQLATEQFLSAYDDHFKPEERATLFRYVQFTNNSIKSLIIEPQLSYEVAFGNGHKLDVLFGTSYQEKNSDGIATYAVGQDSDQQLKNFAAATSYYIGNTKATYRYNALFGRLNYNLHNKYLVNLSARRDGSSRFGSNNLFHNFGALGLGWIFTEEEFFKNQGWLSFGKLKFSYGIAGNDQIDDYLFMSLYSTAYGLPYQSSRGLAAGGIVNPDLQWEETRKIQGGIELGLYNERVLLSLLHYNNRTSNSLANVSIPITTGVSQYVTNLPALIQNSGWEATLRTENIKRKLFSWSTSFNLTIPKNKLVEFPELKSSTYADVYEIGRPLNITKVFSHYGVDPLTGDYLQRDANGDATSSPDFLTDRIAILNNTEQWYGGLQNTLQFKGFELDFLIQFTKQMGLDFVESALPAGAFTEESSNQPVTVLSRWRKLGDIAPIKKYTSNFSFPFFDDRTYKDISYVRLKNLSLTYKLPSMLIRKIRLRQVNLFFLGQNLFTITSYHGLDPETKSVTSLPPLRMLTVGAKIVL